MFFKCSVLTSHIMYENQPLSFSSTCLFLGHLVCRYGTGTSKLSTSCSSYTSINILVNRDSKDTVDDDIYYAYFRWHITFPSLFCPALRLSYSLHPSLIFILVQEIWVSRYHQRFSCHYPFIYMFSLFDHCCYFDFTKVFDDFYPYE